MFRYSKKLYLSLLVGIFISAQPVFASSNSDSKPLSINESIISQDPVYFSDLDGIIVDPGVLILAPEITLDASDAFIQMNGSLVSSGGTVEILADEISLSKSSQINVSSTMGGGKIFVGGGFQGNDPRLANANQVFVEEGAKIYGNATLYGNGAQIIFWADDTMQFYGIVEAQGGPLGGDGGFTEISGKNGLDYDGTVNLLAPLGSTGTLLLDPANVSIVAPGDGDEDAELADHVIDSADSPGSLFAISTTAIINSLDTTNTVIAATADISVEAFLDGDTAGTDHDLTLTAGDEINLGQAITTDSGSITLNAGTDVNMSADLTSDSGSITITGNLEVTGATRTISADDGVISLETLSSDTGAGTQTLNVGNADLLITGDTVEANIVASTGPQTFNIEQSIDFNESTLNCGGDSDEVTAATAEAGVTINLSDLSNCELFTGSAQGDTVTNSSHTSVTINGGDGDDHFETGDGAYFLSTVDGGDGDDTYSYAAWTSGFSSTSVDNYSNIETVVGSTLTTAYLNGSSGVDTFTISGENSGLMGDIVFQDFQGIFGTGGNDTFIFTNDGSLDESIQGDAGTNVLIGDDDGNEFQILDANAGGVPGKVAQFFHMSSIEGGDGDDEFVFADEASLSGTITGGDGEDTLDYSDYGTALEFSLTSLGGIDGFAGEDSGITNGFDDINILIASEEDGDSLEGLNADATWGINDENSYLSSSVLVFSNVDVLIGNLGVDIYHVESNFGGIFMGNIDAEDRLEGDGLIQNALTILDGGTLAPGDEVGTLTLNDGLSMESGSILEIDLDTIEAVDLLDITGTVVLDGPSLEFIGTFSGDLDDEITILSNDGVDPIEGNFSGLTEGDYVVAPGGRFEVSYHGGSGNDITLKWHPGSVGAGSGSGSGGSGSGSSSGNDLDDDIEDIFCVDDLDLDTPEAEWSDEGTLMVSEDGMEFSLKDVAEGEWYTLMIAQLVQQNIVHGYFNEDGTPKGEFGPGNSVTYAELAKMITLSAGLTVDLESTEGAPNPYHWSAPYIVALNNAGVDFFDGFDSAQLDTPATRLDLMELIMMSFQVDPADSVINLYTDMPDDDEASLWVTTLTESCVIEGDDSESTIRPDDEINRAETVAIIVRAQTVFLNSGN